MAQTRDKSKHHHKVFETGPDIEFTTSQKAGEDPSPSTQGACLRRRKYETQSRSIQDAQDISPRLAKTCPSSLRLSFTSGLVFVFYILFLKEDPPNYSSFTTQNLDPPLSCSDGYNDDGIKLGIYFCAMCEKPFDMFITCVITLSFMRTWTISVLFTDVSPASMTMSGSYQVYLINVTKLTNALTRNDDLYLNTPHHLFPCRTWD